MSIVKNKEYYINRINKEGMGKYELIGEFLGTRKSITLKHLICDREFKMIADSFISSGRRCPLCVKDKLNSYNNAKPIHRNYSNPANVMEEVMDSSSILQFL